MMSSERWIAVVQKVEGNATEKKKTPKESVSRIDLTGTYPATRSATHRTHNRNNVPMYFTIKG